MQRTQLGKAVNGRLTLTIRSRSSFARGELAETWAHTEAGLVLYDAKTHQAMASSYGNHDASTCARSFAAWALALAGDEERARAMSDNALAAAKNLYYPFSLAFRLYFLSHAIEALTSWSLIVGAVYPPPRPPAPPGSI